MRSLGAVADALPFFGDRPIDGRRAGPAGVEVTCASSATDSRRFSHVFGACVGRNGVDPNGVARTPDDARRKMLPSGSAGFGSP